MELGGLSAHIAEYIAGRAADRLEKFDKETAKQLQAVHDAAKLAILESASTIERKALVDKYEPGNWLTDAALRATQIQMVTHALKFTHPDARGSSLYDPGDCTQADGMGNGLVVTTLSLSKPVIDVVGNAAALDVAALLQLSHEGKSLVNSIAQGDGSPLQPFARDELQLAEWLAGFTQVLSGNEPSSHKYAKQLYFPIADGNYHLLAPLYSSSLAHAIYSRIAATRYPEEIKAVRKAKKDGKYHATQLIDFPDTAMRTFGGTKPQNVSQLNSKQGGKSFLLNCAPPHWEALAKPPLKVKSVFSRNHFGWRVRREIRNLRDYLLHQLVRNSTKPARDQRSDYVDQVLDQLVQYAAEIRTLAGYGGWSALPECRLPLAEQLWLDPQRVLLDDAFAREREKNEWQAVVADRFALWLNNRIKHEKMTMSDAEHGEWKKLALEVLD